MGHRICVGWCVDGYQLHLPQFVHGLQERGACLGSMGVNSCSAISILPFFKSEKGIVTEESPLCRVSASLDLVFRTGMARTFPGFMQSS